MHRNINAPFSQSAFKLNHENAVPADLRQRNMRHGIAGGADLFNNYLQVWPVALELLDYPARLYHRQLAGSCPDD